MHVQVLYAVSVYDCDVMKHYEEILFMILGNELYIDFTHYQINTVVLDSTGQCNGIVRCCILDTNVVILWLLAMSSNTTAGNRVVH